MTVQYTDAPRWIRNAFLVETCGAFCEAKVAVYYWLSKCAQGCDSSEETRVLEDLLLKFTSEVRHEAMYLGFNF